MFSSITRKLRRAYFLLQWSVKTRIHALSLLFISMSIISGLIISIRSFGKKPLGNLPILFEDKRTQTINQLKALNNKIDTESEIYRFDVTSIQQYALDTLDDLTTDQVIYLKSELEKETKVDPRLPSYPGSVPPPSKPRSPATPTKPPPAETPPPPQPTNPPETPTPEPEPEPEEPPPSEDPQEIAEAILNSINIERDKAGVQALSMNGSLVALAIGHSDDMNKRGYFSHTTPEGVTFPQRLRNAGFNAGGENLYFAGRSSFSPKEPVSSWLNSPGHKRNMLYSGYNQAGIGVSGPYVTADFAP